MAHITKKTNEWRNETRGKILELVRQGLRPREIIARLGVSNTAVWDVRKELGVARHNQKLTPELRKIILAAALRKQPLVEIRKQLGVSITSIRMVRKMHKLPKLKKYYQLTDAQREQVVAAARQGLTIAALIARFGVSQSTISRIKRARGLNGLLGAPQLTPEQQREARAVIQAVRDTRNLSKRQRLSSGATNQSRRSTRQTGPKGQRK
ncbi:MAG: helix-turn-helix domain-containing protein [Verrucomicrobiales bacterium]|jgi:transposase|nr:helix-turn-helix domain-containing protein [Verrucomicrobiales bacterium]